MENQNRLKKKLKVVNRWINEESQDIMNYLAQINIDLNKRQFSDQIKGKGSIRFGKMALENFALRMLKNRLEESIKENGE